jgi:hypothetical protein
MIMVRRVVPSLLVLVLMSACASVGSFNTLAESTTHSAIAQSESLHTAKVLTDAQFQAINLQLNRVAVAGRELTKVLAAGTATTVNVQAFLAVIAQVTANLQGADYGSAIASSLQELSKLEAKAQQILGQVPAPAK